MRIYVVTEVIICLVIFRCVRWFTVLKNVDPGSGSPVVVSFCSRFPTGSAGNAVFTCGDHFYFFSFQYFQSPDLFRP